MIDQIINKVLNILKRKATSAAEKAIYSKAADAITPVIVPLLQKYAGDSPDTIQDDKQYKEKVVAPAWSAVKGKVGGFIDKIPGLEKKFSSTLIKMKNDIFAVKDGKVVVKEDGIKKISNTLIHELENM